MPQSSNPGHITTQTVLASALSADLIRQILALEESVWPGQRDHQQEYQTFLSRNHQRPARRVTLAIENGKLLAHAETFSREIRCAGETLKVGCLSGVCVSPARQQQGLGKIVVALALDSSHRDGLPVVLFQTGVAGFYRKLGAAQVTNRFVDSLAADPGANPWWDPQIMIHPGDYLWPDGVVDLRGGAF